jgi:hypothetical protein
MPIPSLNHEGFLPAGIFECTLEEVRARFGVFQGSSRRADLFSRLANYISEVRLSRMAISVIIDGSFVSGISEPNDIDLILELSPQHNFASDLNPAEYNVVSKRRVHRRFGFDLLCSRAFSGV